jgi:hypothetical protein
MVIKSPVAALAFCLALSPAVLPFAAKADPRVLTASELAGLTAGAVKLPSIQINVNTNAQVAVAAPIAVAVCAACKSPSVIAVAEGRASNFNLAQLTNLVP